MTTTKQGYVNGSDLLAKVAGKPTGHATSHTTTFNSETKERAVKPVATQPVGSGLWKEVVVNGLGVEVKCEGLCFYQETENGFKPILTEWKKGQPVELELFERENDEKPYLSGMFIITSIERTAPAGDDVTYSASFKSTGMPTIDETGITEGETTGA